MTTSSITHKVCKRCGIEKPLTEFYTHSQGRFHLGECKACRKTHPQKPHNRHAATVPSEINLIAKLRGMGIPAIPGKLLGQKYADVIAWGCVLLEAKASPPHGSQDNPQFIFKFTYKQSEEGIRGDLVVLICNHSDYDTYYVLPADTPGFYRIDGKVKLSLCWTLNSHGSGRPPALTDDQMYQAQDAWYLIEQRRLEISKVLIAGGDMPLALR